MSLGQRLYEEKPGQFVRNMKKLWDAWKNQPSELKDEEKQQRQATKKPSAKTAPARVKTTAA
jgi:Sec-independent protein translocase protein TatA